ncbi:hypothetical protein [Phenylobacterium sp. SCN 70-31]|uniref:hypothetical protein n=1 Tax=Phenylobacterium sp. SCN 70-31 TaxID=1660129 RepID=UPI00086F0D0B|nr:hypothetical protein [Phenylobacterium sp. SCN 70-31]ODT88510.1 MAG: hypothetical protein ABS78_07830 [Phenylobacterium sp. SCN 70-31]
MRKVMTSALAAVVAAGAVLATAGPANADRRYHHRHHDRGNDEVAAAIIGGVAGLALGAALAGNGRRDRGYDYNGYAYDPRYDRYSGGYYRGYDRAPRYRTCVVRDRVYDPYIGRRVTVERRYAC